MKNLILITTLLLCFSCKYEEKEIEKSAEWPRSSASRQTHEDPRDLEKKEKVYKKLVGHWRDNQCLRHLIVQDGDVVSKTKLLEYTFSPTGWIKKRTYYFRDELCGKPVAMEMEEMPFLVEVFNLSVDILMYGMIQTTYSTWSEELRAFTYSLNDISERYRSQKNAVSWHLESLHGDNLMYSIDGQSDLYQKTDGIMFKQVRGQSLLRGTR